MAYPPQHSPLLGDPTAPANPALAESTNSPYLYSDDGASNIQYSSMDGQSTLGLHARQRSYVDDKEEAGVETPALGAGAGDAGRGTRGSFWSRLSQRAKRFFIVGIILLIIVLIIAIAVPTAITKSNAKSNVAVAAEGDSTSSSRVSSRASSSRASSTSTSTSSSASAAPTPSGRPAWGGDGSTVYAEDGTTFTYNNSFGGFWNAVPFNDSARPQSYSPALDEAWDYNADTIRGVNLGGWLTIEPFIVPGLFEPFNGPGINPDATVVDEWTLCEALGSNMSAVITEHYETFITEKDFAEIAAAGLNWIRLPIPWWIIEVWDDEPFLANVGWTYFLKAISWARKYGLRINLDLHAVPGSQNGYNHSGKLGSINFLQSVMGIANAQRTLNYIRTLTEFISQDEYKNVVPMFSILNEPYGPSIGMEPVRHFYFEVYNMMREITGNGEGNGPFIAFHDAFAPQNDVDDADFTVARGGWNGWMPGSDRVSLDTHPYLCFSAPNDDPLPFQASKPCSYWGAKMNITSATVGLSIAGEWSLAINDCGKWLNQVGNGQRFDGTYFYPGTSTRPFEGVGSCDEWNNYDTWSDATKEGLMNVAMAHMDSFRHFFFWTWKTGYSQQLGKVANPFWNYQLGLAEGWVPRDPRAATGICPSLVAAADVTYPTFEAPPLSAWQTGGAGAGTILDTAMEASYTAWPPVSLGTLAVSDMPTLTPTGSIVTMRASRPTSFPEGYATATPNVGDGWFNSADDAGWYTKIAGCDYPPAFSAGSTPTTACNAGSRRMKRSPSPAAPTAPPSPRR